MSIGSKAPRQYKGMGLFIFGYEKLHTVEILEIKIKYIIFLHNSQCTWGQKHRRSIGSCCCQVASVVSDSVRPHRRQPTRLPCPWDSPGKNTGVGRHFLLQCMKVKSESEVAQSCRLLTTPWTAAHQAPPSMGFARQDYWSGVRWPSLRRIGRTL